ncbi:heavy metal-binding domain-containing protein [Daejeonella sp.]|jgi:Cu(I)/Ag(I) efflux system membrane fusion protein|uniref:heavy metal-binding domain-containing protein n=1 Tax=Daejeonella sp. TaxID=2805397 RepID=UPI0037844489
MKNLINTCVVLIVLFFASCTSSEKPVQSSADTSTHNKAHAVYTCPMHPKVLSDKPGICPECKMDLVKKTDKASSSDSTTNEHHQH